MAEFFRHGERDKLIDRHSFTALTGKFPPFSYYGNQGNLAGFDVDVEGIPASLPAEKYDAVTGSMKKNKAGTG